MRRSHVLCWLAAAAVVGCEGDTGSPEAADTHGPTGAPWTPGPVVAEDDLGPEPGFVRTDSGTVSLGCGEGALAGTEHVTITALTLPADDPFGVPGAAYLVEPADLAPALPCNLTIRFAPELLPLDTVAAHFGVYRWEEGEGWQALGGGMITGALSEGTLLYATGFPTRFGAFGVRVADPYAAPPVLSWIGVTKPQAWTDDDGVKGGWTPGYALPINGSGFGWDPEVVTVTVAGQEQTANLHVTTSRITVNAWIEPRPTETVEVPVQVTVKGQPSNTMMLRALGPGSCPQGITNLTPVGAPPGMSVRVRLANGCGLEADTLEVRLGGTLVPWQVPCAACDLVFVVPEGAAAGETEITVADGLGGAASEPWRFVVLPTTPPVLSAGLEAGGFWTGYTGLENGFGGGPYSESAVVLRVEGLEPKVGDWSRLEVRWTTTSVDTGFFKVLAQDGFYPPCEGLPAGRCVLLPPAQIYEGLAAGDPVSVALRVSQRVQDGDAPPDGWVVRESAPLALTFAGSADPGSRTWLNVGTDAGDAFCPAEQLPLSVGDTVCLYLGNGQECAVGDCEHEVQTLRAPALWDGELAFSRSWPAGREVEGKCFPLDEPGTVTVENVTLGTSCDIGVVWTLGASTGVTLSGLDPSRDAVAAFGGARLVIPAGALPEDPEGGYTVTALGPAPDTEPAGSGDPQKPLKTGTFSVHVQPEPGELKAPLTLGLPFDPGLGAPELGFIDELTGVAHPVDALVDAVDGLLEWDFPVGPYRAPTGPADAVAMPVTFNTVAGRIGVMYQSDTPGKLVDPQGRCTVDYVVDVASADHVPEPYAAKALAACIAAHDELKGLGWRVPKEPAAISIRKSVSWADFSGAAKGATTPGYASWFGLGQSSITISSAISPSDKIPYVVTHEVGHLFQREYTTNFKLSWLDEAMGEWTAYQALGLGVGGYYRDGMTEDEAGVRVPTLGFGDSWGTYPSEYVYGTQVFTLWTSWKYGPAAIRQLFEALDWSPTAWVSPWATFQAATGQDVASLMKAFSEDFWLQRFEPVDQLTVSALLDGVVNVKHALLGEAGLAVDLLPRPALSSLRYRVDVKAAAAAAVAGGDAVLRVTGAGAAHQVQVWTEAGPTQDPDEPSLVALLGQSKPVMVVPVWTAGVYWVIDTNYASTEAVDGSLALAFPRITGLSPASGKTGVQVVVSAHDLGNTEGMLKVGGQEVAPIGWNDTQVVFKLPAFANTGAVGVRLITADGARTNEPFFTVVP